MNATEILAIIQICSAAATALPTIATDVAQAAQAIQALLSTSQQQVSAGTIDAEQHALNLAVAQLATHAVVAKVAAALPLKPHQS